MLVDFAEQLNGVAADAQDRRSPQRLEQALRRGCWIYGAGGYGRTILRLLEARDIAPLGFIDRRAAEHQLLPGLSANALAPAEATPELAAGRALIVALHNFAADQRPIVEWARGLGFAEILIPAELPDVLGEQAGSYWLSERAHAARHRSEIAHLIDLLADPKSEETVAALARFRVSGDIAAHPASDLSDQYFPRDLAAAPRPLRLIDGGAFTGDILESAAKLNVEIDEWYAFEPDSTNFAALARSASSPRVHRAVLFPAGLGARSEQIRFSSGEAAGSHAASTGDTVAQVVALDDVLRGVAPTYVKLDIEGFEREALDGMRDTLARCRPRLAVAIYHKPEDLWELPFKVRVLLPDAKLYVRQHGFNGFDTVLYAVP